MTPDVTGRDGVDVSEMIPWVLRHVSSAAMPSVVTVESCQTQPAATKAAAAIAAKTAAVVVAPGRILTTPEQTTRRRWLQQ